MSCRSNESKVKSAFLKDPSDKPLKLDPYWYEGKAEISTYELSQNRYRDQHPGEVVLIFVTEDFLTDIQVKNDRYRNKNSTNVLKMNKVRRFITGLYDYSIMTSCFSPIDLDQFPHALKVTCSSQDWCGQSYQQINLTGNKYESKLHSYFENEADRNDHAEVVWLEDEMMNRLRMGPERLPVGSFKMIPSAEYLRLRHKPFSPVKSTASLEAYSGSEFEGENLMAYSIEIQSDQRKLSIVYEDAKPYKVMGWTDQYPSSFDGKLRTTIARKKGEEYLPYWQQNGKDQSEQRKDLNLMF